MKTSILYAVSACFGMSALFLFALSCKKSDSPQPTAPSAPTGTLQIALSYPDPSAQPAANVELIISEPNGKVLLDTIASVNTMISATLHTNATLVNVTTLAQDADTNLTVTTYTGVNPASWRTAIVNDYSSPSQTQLTPLALSLINIPSTYQTGNEPILISNTSKGAYSLPLLADVSAFNTGIDGSVNNPIYMLLPSRLLYSFTPVASPNDTVVNGPSTVIDFSQRMDTARQLTLNKPAGFSTPYNVTLYGIMDTTDFSKTLLLYEEISFFPGEVGLPDVVYPPKYVQKYELKADFFGPNNIAVSLYSYGDSLTGTFPFPTSAAYTLASNQPDSFSVKFLSVSPTYYVTEWNTGKVFFFEYSSPDSTVQHPLALLSALNAQKLKGIGLNSLKASSFDFGSVQGMDYAGYLSYACDPTAILTKRVKSAINFYDYY